MKSKILPLSCTLLFFNVTLSQTKNVELSQKKNAPDKQNNLIRTTQEDKGLKVSNLKYFNSIDKKEEKVNDTIANDRRRLSNKK